MKKKGQWGGGDFQVFGIDVIEQTKEKKEGWGIEQVIRQENKKEKKKEGMETSISF